MALSESHLVLPTKLTPKALQDQVLQIPQIASWPEIYEIFPDNEHETVRLDWQLPGIACEALGHSSAEMLSAMAGLACLQISIILVDDILDEEEEGAHHRLGTGRTANLALALQSAALLLIDRCPAPVERQAAATLSLSRMMLATAHGQDLDVRNFEEEDGYWQVVRAKSTPFYGSALEIGGLLAGADEETCNNLYAIGVLFGEAVQIMDDLEDAFQSPANSDWLQGRNNLPILYGLLAEYEEKPLFLQLKARADDPEALSQAQSILIQSGAVSYCCFHLAQRHREIHRLIDQSPLSNPELLLEVMDIQLAPFIALLNWIQPGLDEEFKKLM